MPAIATGVFVNLHPLLHGDLHYNKQQAQSQYISLHRGRGLHSNPLTWVIQATFAETCK